MPKNPLPHLALSTCIEEKGSPRKRSVIMGPPLARRRAAAIMTVSGTTAAAGYASVGTKFKPLHRDLLASSKLGLQLGLRLGIVSACDPPQDPQDAKSRTIDEAKRSRSTTNDMP